MSILKEINESHISLKAISFNLFLIPFWYVAIFIFNNEFYKSADSIIILAMCIVITLSSSGYFSFVLSFFKVESDKRKAFFTQMILAVSILCAWLSLLIFIVYSLGFLFDIYIYFYSFLSLYFIPIFISHLLAIIMKD